MSKILTGKVAVVTGGGRGLGRAFAHALGAEGAQVVVASRNQTDLDRVVAEAAEADYKAVAIQTDVTSEESVNNLVQQSVDHFGSVDILVNNSGVVLTKPLVDMTVDEWDRLVDTNLRGTFLAAQAAARQMIAQARGGKIINIASNFGLKGIPNHTGYSASKAGVIGFTRSAAVELSRHNIQVNAIAPGYFVTDMNTEVRANHDLQERILKTIPARRMGEADELSSWIVSLAGTASDFMTGEVIVIDGGQTVV
ncbi:3-oxoacyl-[acyl-carrier-protein] reductase FabG [Rhodococcus erythropolis]|uniref:SDR family NAD(P)-dependent oxidoreductase n=1 Tax=Rhodococcus erythropolis TaxID=1833 RepID=UPI000BB37DE6|nr:3-oxoacyl-ACP reductase family protein [Rhodococcus erythropolis]PBI91946.1 3-oxoacyl-[acyl-carrier-protein] reductase FabG [Rhodococcus erythropolis]